MKLPRGIAPRPPNSLARALGAMHSSARPQAAMLREVEIATGVTEPGTWTLADIEQSIGARFDAQVSTWPDRPAVVSGRDRWTYRKLLERSNGVASALLSETGPGNDPVALMFDQGAPLVAAIVGALKSGKIYVPLDPADPEARQRAIIADAVPAAILCDETNAVRARSIAGRTRVISYSADIASGIGSVIGANVSADTLAYIYYTSGSTGTPKGVVDNHRNVLHNILRYTNNLRITPDDRLTLVQSAAFSGAVSSLFSAILNGACAYPFDLRRNGTAGLAALMLDERITMYHSVPSIFRSVTKHADRFPSVRVVRLEGDRAELRDVELFRRHFPESTELAVGLGATETGLSCQHVSGNGVPLPRGAVPIGQATRDVHLRVVDDNAERVREGEPGELIISSAYLAIGYWKRPELTRAAFTDQSDNGIREFRTGDIARVCPDGQLEYVGRKDHRLRINGHSIEPLYVEQALAALPGIREAVVGSRNNARGDPILVSWVVPANGHPPSSSEIRQRLAAKLPLWMIPSRFVVVDSMPLSSNGKLDRHGLTDDWKGAESSPGRKARTRLERIIADVWRDVLEVGQVGVDDDFFELGGDSLAAVRASVDIEEKIGRPLAASEIFVNPTVHGLAASLERHDADGASIVCLQPLGSRKPLFLVHPASGDILMYHALAAALGERRPVHAIRAAGGYAQTPSVESIARLYVDQIRSIEPDGPYHLGGFCFGAHVAHEIARRLESSGATVATLFVIDTDAEERLNRSVADSIAIHARRIGKLRGLAIASYLIDRAGYRVARFNAHLIARIGSPLFGRHATKHPAVRRALLTAAHDRAGSSHRPLPWSGRVTYVNPSDRVHLAPTRYWTTVSAGLSVIDIPVTSDRIFGAASAGYMAAAMNAAMDD